MRVLPASFYRARMSVCMRVFALGPGVLAQVGSIPIQGKEEASSPDLFCSSWVTRVRSFDLHTFPLLPLWDGNGNAVMSPTSAVLDPVLGATPTTRLTPSRSMETQAFIDAIL